MSTLTEEAEAIMGVARVLDTLPHDKMRVKALALVAVQLENYEQAIRCCEWLIQEAAQIDALVKEPSKP